MEIMRFSTVCLLTGVLLTCALASYAQDVADVAEAEVTTQSGSRGVMVRPLGPGPFPAVLHLHGSGDIVADNVQILRLFARAGYVAMDIEYRRTAAGSIDIGDSGEIGRGRVTTALRLRSLRRHARAISIGKEVPAADNLQHVLGGTHKWHGVQTGIERTANHAFAPHG